MYFATKELPVSCFVEVVRLPWVPEALACYVLLFPTCWNKPFSSQIRTLQQGEQVWNGFQVTETPCIQPVPSELWPSNGLLGHIYRRGLGGKKAMVPFQSKPLLELLLVHRIVYIWQGGSFLASSFVELMSVPSGTDHPHSLCGAFTCLWRGLFKPNKATPQRKTHLDSVSSYRPHEKPVHL